MGKPQTALGNEWTKYSIQARFDLTCPSVLLSWGTDSGDDSDLLISIAVRITLVICVSLS